MRTLIAMTLAVTLLVPVPVAARGFDDLRIDLAAAPWRMVEAVSGWHPLADARAALERTVAAFEELSLQAADIVAILWSRLALGSIEVAESADRAAAAFVHAAFPERAEPMDTPPPAPSSQRGGDPGSDARWVTELERLLTENQDSP